MCLIMCKVAVALACMACVGHGRRFQTPIEQLQRNQLGEEPPKAFASLLLALFPEAAFTASRAVGGRITTSCSHGGLRTLDMSQATPRRTLLAGCFGLGLGATVWPARAIDEIGATALAPDLVAIRQKVYSLKQKFGEAKKAWEKDANFDLPVVFKGTDLDAGKFKALVLESAALCVKADSRENLESLGPRYEADMTELIKLGSEGDKNVKKIKKTLEQIDKDLVMIFSTMYVDSKPVEKLENVKPFR